MGKKVFNNAHSGKADDKSNYAITELSCNRYSCRRYINRMLYTQWCKGNGMSYANIGKIHDSLGRNGICVLLGMMGCYFILFPKWLLKRRGCHQGLSNLPYSATRATRATVPRYLRLTAARSKLCGKFF